MDPQHCWDVGNNTSFQSICSTSHNVVVCFLFSLRSLELNLRAGRTGRLAAGTAARSRTEGPRHAVAVQALRRRPPRPAAAVCVTGGQRRRRPVAAFLFRAAVFVLFLLLLLLFAALAVGPLLSAHEGGVRAPLCEEVRQLQALGGVTGIY